jgi:hypothetical protein
VLTLERLATPLISAIRLSWGRDGDGKTLKEVTTREGSRVVP